MAELKKVVHVMRRLVPDKWGGTESSVFHSASALMEQGIDSPVHCTAMFSRRGPGSVGPVRVIRHRYVFPWFGLSDADREALRLKGGSPLSLPLFAGLMREQKVSIIHTHVLHRLGGMARTAARLKRIPYVVSLHGGYFTIPDGELESLQKPFAGRMEWGRIFGALFGSRRVLQDADAIVCVGRAEYDEVTRRLPHRPVFLIPNGVQVQRFAHAGPELFRGRYGFAASDRLVLCVSRIDFQKNQPGLVRAFARFSVDRPDHRLVLLGPVSVQGCADALRAEIARHGLEARVAIIPGLHPDDPLLPSAYKAAEMFVLPSVHEPFGIVVLEAWAAGLPVVAARSAGIFGSSADRDAALLFDPADEEAMAGAMGRLADNPALRSELAGRAFRRVSEAYDWGAVTARLRAVYESLLSSP